MEWLDSSGYQAPAVSTQRVDGMSEQIAAGRDSFRLYLLTAFLSALAGVVLFLPEWSIANSAQPQYWNGIVAFSILAVLCDSSFLPIPRITSANVRTSVAFIPLLASILLFEHPWPMLMSGLAALVVDAFLRRKPMIRVWFNVAQYMLAVGVGGLAYKAAGGVSGLQHFDFGLIPFVALVATFFVINQGSVAWGLASLGQMSVWESWSRIAGGSLLYDFISSSLAVLLAFLYIRLQLVGLAILILPLFFVRHMYQMNLQVERVNRELLELMVKAIEARDPYTSGHSVRVAEYARQIARELGLNPKQVDQIGTAALLHDVGKIHEDFAPLLRKAGRLTPEERMLMQAHPVRSADLAGTIAEFRGRVQMDIRNHHENFDGTGYPDGLTGESIPIGARIIMIADTIDAMTTDRPYRKALTLQRALDEITKHAGRQFDPRLVELVCKSPGIRRLLGPQLAADGPHIKSMNLPSRSGRHGVHAVT
jgi:putative nucleotidyltransferase with HDIG domain